MVHRHVLKFMRKETSFVNGLSESSRIFIIRAPTRTLEISDMQNISNFHIMYTSEISDVRVGCRIMRILDDFDNPLEKLISLGINFKTCLCTMAF